MAQRNQLPQYPQTLQQGPSSLAKTQATATPHTHPTDPTDRTRIDPTNPGATHLTLTIKTHRASTPRIKASTRITIAITINSNRVTTTIPANTLRTMKGKATIRTIGEATTTTGRVTKVTTIIPSTRITNRRRITEPAQRNLITNSIRLTTTRLRPKRRTRATLRNRTKVKKGTEPSVRRIKDTTNPAIRITTRTRLLLTPTIRLIPSTLTSPTRLRTTTQPHTHRTQTSTINTTRNILVSQIICRLTQMCQIKLSKLSLVIRTR